MWFLSMLRGFVFSSAQLKTNANNTVESCTCWKDAQTQQSDRRQIKRKYVDTVQ